LVWSAILMNLLDAVMTILWVKAGVAEEANLMLRDVLEKNVPLFFLIKMSLATLGLYLLWRRRDRKLAMIGIILVSAVYYVLILYHVQILMLVVCGEFPAAMECFAQAIVGLPPD